MNIRDKLKGMESKLLEMQEKLVEDDKDPVKKITDTILKLGAKNKIIDATKNNIAGPKLYNV